MVFLQVTRTRKKCVPLSLFLEFMTKIFFFSYTCQRKQDKFDEFISPDEGLFEKHMKITKHKSHLSISISDLSTQTQRSRVCVLIQSVPLHVGLQFFQIN